MFGSIAWENSWHLVTLPLVSLPNNVCETSAEISYWWCVTTLIWVGLLIGRIKFSPWHTTYSDLGSDASNFLLSFLRGHLAGKLVVVSPNVGCFLRLLTVFMWLLLLPVPRKKNMTQKIWKHLVGGRLTVTISPLKLQIIIIIRH